MSFALAFTEGASFLSDASTVALKGRIEFYEDHATESGSFQLLANGRDSTSFLIEGPLGVDVFRMLVLGNRLYVLQDGEWMEFGEEERVNIPDYGVGNINPALVAALIFPQYYLKDSLEVNETEEGIQVGTTRFRAYKGHSLAAANVHNDRGFAIYDEKAGIGAKYGYRKEIENGHYPSEVAITGPEGTRWKLFVKITKLKLNAPLPLRIWERE
jgi:hypothetical protein